MGHGHYLVCDFCGHHFMLQAGLRRNLAWQDARRDGWRVGPKLVLCPPHEEDSRKDTTEGDRIRRWISLRDNGT